MHLKNPVYITNAAPYAEDVEDGRVRLRSVNLPVEMLHMAYDKFNSMGAISQARANELARRTL